LVADEHNILSKATLAAIDEGIRDAQAGRVYSPEEIRKFLSKRITAPLHAKSDNRPWGFARFPRTGGIVRQKSRVRKLLHSAIEVVHFRQG